jgi:hypothetical protein
MPQKYSGGCQCGKVRYEVSLDLSSPVISCNCSRCGRLGSLLAFAPASELKLLSGEDATTEFHFNKHKVHHRFCATCGIQSYSKGTAPNGAEMAAINVRCLDGVDVDSLTIQTFNGRDL